MTCNLKICIGWINVLHLVFAASGITQDCLVGTELLAKHKCLIEGRVQCGRISLAKD